MKVTKDLVKQFEADQKAKSTAVAIHNVLWTLAVDQLKDLGIRKVTTVKVKE